MTSMVEKVARAIDAKAFDQSEVARRFVESAGRTWDGSWEHNLHRAKVAVAMKKARAAIEAMMEPTSAMLEATYLRPFEADEIWRGMIATALSEESTS